MHYTPEIQDQIVKRYIQAGVFPDNIQKIMFQADKVYAKMMNTENDADYLKDPHEDYFYPGGPSGGRRRDLTKKRILKVEKLVEKKKLIEEEDDDGSDAEVKRSKKYDRHTLAMQEVVDGKQLLKDHFEGILIKGIQVEFNSDDEIEEVLDDEGEVITEQIKKHDVWLDAKQRHIMNTLGLYMIKQIVKELSRPGGDAIDQSKLKRANLALKN